MNIRILLADDHNLMRQGVRALIAEHPGMTVVAEAADGASAVRQALALSPDIVIMDVSMPGVGGIEATRRLSEAKATSKIIALSMHLDRRKILDILAAGASGYLLKDCLLEEVVCAVRRVLSEGMYLSPAVLQLVLTDFIRCASAEGASPFTSLSTSGRKVLRHAADGRAATEIASLTGMKADKVSSCVREIVFDHIVPYFQKEAGGTAELSPLSLTMREREILAWIREGKGSWEISSILGLSQETVKYHLKKTYRKLNATNRTQAIAVALNNNLLDART